MYVIDVCMKGNIFHAHWSSFLHQYFCICISTCFMLFLIFYIYLLCLFIQKNTAMQTKTITAMSDAEILSTAMVCTMFSVMIVLVPTVLY